VQFFKLFVPKLGKTMSAPCRRPIDAKKKIKKFALILGATSVMNKPKSAIFQTFCAKNWQNNVGFLPTAAS
jgi:hypothetical protein